MGCYNAAHPEKVKASRSRDDDDDDEDEEYDNSSSSSYSSNTKLSSLFNKTSVRKNSEEQFKKFIVIESLANMKKDGFSSLKLDNSILIKGYDALPKYIQTSIRMNAKKNYNVIFPDTRNIYEKLRQNKWFMLALTICTGWFGGHYYFLGRIGKGIAYTITAGYFVYFGWLPDIVRVFTNKLEDENGDPYVFVS